MKRNVSIDLYISLNSTSSLHHTLITFPILLNNYVLILFKIFALMCLSLISTPVLIH